MDHEEEFLNAFFTQVAQLCSDKAKESVVSNKQKIEYAYTLIKIRVFLYNCINKNKFNLGERKRIMQTNANGSMGYALNAFTTNSCGRTFVRGFRFSSHQK